jgi:hypothetical protein
MLIATLVLLLFSIPKKMLEMKLRGRRPKGRPQEPGGWRQIWKKRGKKWTQVKQDREGEDRWRFLCNSRPKELETT